LNFFEQLNSVIIVFKERKLQKFEDGIT